MSKIGKTKVLMTCGSLMKVESIAECSFVAFCNISDLHEALMGLESRFWSSFRVAVYIVRLCLLYKGSVLVPIAYVQMLKINAHDVVSGWTWDQNFVESSPTTMHCLCKQRRLWWVYAYVLLDNAFSATILCAIMWLVPHSRVRYCD